MTPDVRCAARLTSELEDEQCELYVGHDGEHAVLVTRDQQRTLVRWTSGSTHSEPFGAAVPAQLPWAPGRPSMSSPNPVGLDASRPAQPVRRLRTVPVLPDQADGSPAKLHIA